MEFADPLSELLIGIDGLQLDLAGCLHLFKVPCAAVRKINGNNSPDFVLLSPQIVGDKVGNQKHHRFFIFCAAIFYHMPCTWNGLDPRACICASVVSSGNEILHPSPHVSLASPGVLVVGIYALNSPIPLRYVPSKFRDGVQHGWYAPLLSKDDSFVVATSWTHSAESKMNNLGFDSIIAHVKVDDIEAHPNGRVLNKNEYICRGFTLNSCPDEDATIVRNYRPFVFGGEEDSNAFSITVEAHGATTRENATLSNAQYIERSKEQNALNHPSVANYALSVRRFVRPEAPVYYHFQLIPEFSVGITFRSAKWLQHNGIFIEEELKPKSWLSLDRKNYCVPSSYVSPDTASAASGTSAARWRGNSASGDAVKGEEENDGDDDGVVIVIEN